ncbi:Abi family protein [Leuconostoc citreum]|uniref:Abi family protein n=1 Tax=Leuconostoc citreum TaxID=33964 RepID=UPI00200B2468|nr:Abi family protein [Leuconostoc citreum]MCK8606142.1 Abi family protein [Leuconostoc citreum]
MVTHNSRPFNGFNKLTKIAKSKHNIDTLETSEISREFLISDSYYSLLNGYQNVLCKEGQSEEFLDGLTLEKLDLLYFLESNLSASLFHNILFIEKRFKTALQYVVSKHLGTKDLTEYLFWNEKYYNSRNNREVTSILKKLLQITRGHYFHNDFSEGAEIDPEKEHVSQAILDHRNYGNVPPWVLANELTLGESIRWYNSLKDFLKQEIIYLAFPNIRFSTQTNRFKNPQNLNFITDALTIIQDFRNGTAHGTLLNKINFSRLLRWNDISKLLDLHNVMNKQDYENGLGQNDLLAIYMIIIILSDARQLTLLTPHIKVIIEQLPSIFDSNNIEAVYKAFLIPNDFLDRIENIKFPE